MIDPFSKEEIPARQNPKPTLRPQLNDGLCNLTPSQQPPIVGTVEYLTQGDTIQCSTDGGQLCQDNSSDLIERPSIYPRINIWT